MTDRDSGLRKAAILISSIDEQAAASMMEAIDSDLLEALNKELSRLGDVKTEEKDEVMEEFRNIQVMESSSSVDENASQNTDGSFRSDSTPVIRVPAIVQEKFQAEGQVEEDSLFQNRSEPRGSWTHVKRDEEGHVSKLWSSEDQRGTPFAFLENLLPKMLVRLIDEEPPRIVAVILRYLQPGYQKEVLRYLSSDCRDEVMGCLQLPESIAPGFSRGIEQRLSRRLEKFRSNGIDLYDRQGENVRALSRDSDSEQSVGKDSLEGEQWLSMEDLLHCEQRVLCSCLVQMEPADAVLALWGASRQLRNRCIQGLPQSVASYLKQEMQTLGPVRVCDVEMAQTTLLDAVKEWEDSSPESVRSFTEPIQPIWFKRLFRMLPVFQRS